MCNNSLCSLLFPRGEKAHRRPILIGNQLHTGQAWSSEPRESAELTGISLLWPIHWCKAKGYLIPLYVYIYTYCVSCNIRVQNWPCLLIIMHLSTPTTCWEHRRWVLTALIVAFPSNCWEISLQFCS